MTRNAQLPAVDEVLVDWSPGETRIALLRAGEPWELLVDRSSRPSIVGNVYLGRIVGIERGLGAAFVDIGTDAPGMLKPGRTALRLHEGQKLVVQVAQDPHAEKGPGLSASVRLAGRYLVFTPARPGLAASRRIPDPDTRQRLQGLAKGAIGPEEGAVLRTAAASATDAGLLGEVSSLRTTWRKIEQAAAETEPPTLLHRELSPSLAFLRDALPAGPVPVLVDDRRTMAALTRFVESHVPEYAGRLELHEGPDSLFDERGIETEIEAVLERDRPLPGRGSISIEHTRALTAIDVDTGGSDRKDTNLAAAREAARLIRFRNISGLIAIDFAGGGAAESSGVLLAAIRNAFAEDRASVRFGPISEFGLFEMSRERLGPALSELIARSRAAAFDANAETRLISALRRIVRQRPPPPQCVLEASEPERRLLEGPLAPALRDAEQRLGYAVTIASRRGPA